MQSFKWLTQFTNNLHSLQHVWFFIVDMHILTSINNHLQEACSLRICNNIDIDPIPRFFCNNYDFEFDITKITYESLTQAQIISWNG